MHCARRTDTRILQSCAKRVYFANAMLKLELQERQCLTKWESLLNSYWAMFCAAIGFNFSHLHIYRSLLDKTDMGENPQNPGLSRVPLDKCPR